MFKKYIINAILLQGGTWICHKLALFNNVFKSSEQRYFAKDTVVPSLMYVLTPASEY